MKIIIDILHPAHVHVFKHFYKDMIKKGHEILVTAREKDVTLYLLKYYKIPYIKISNLAKNKIGLGIELISRTKKFYSICKKFKPDLLMGCMGPTIAPIGKLLGIPTVVFYNNETAGLTNWYTYRLATRFITSTSYEDKVKGNHITHNSYHELAYLYPGRDKINDKGIKLAGIKKGEKFFFIRLVSWQSSHDIGAKGFSNKVRFIEKLSNFGRVVINSESKKLPKILRKYAITVPPEYIQSLMSHAFMFIGESATMAAEAAIMGVPTIYIANTFRGYTNEMEHKYGVVFNFKNQTKAEKKIFELLKNKNIKTEWKIKANKMIKDKVDMSSWMIDYVENKKYII